MDYKALMKNEDNIDDVLTLSWFKGWLGGLDIISNQESKIKKTGCYEIHDQFISELGVQYLVNAFQNYLKNNIDSLEVTDTDSAKKLILDFLDTNEIRYFFDPNINDDENDTFDDLLTYCKNLCGRTVLSLVLDKGRHQNFNIHSKINEFDM